MYEGAGVGDGVGDGDGVDDYTIIGCIPELDEQPNQDNDSDNNGDNNTVVDDLDSDNDGILDEFDDCPDTEAGAATDTQGWSNEQNKNQVYKDTEEDGINQWIHRKKGI